MNSNAKLLAALLVSAALVSCSSNYATTPGGYDSAADLDGLLASSVDISSEISYPTEYLYDSAHPENASGEISSAYEDYRRAYDSTLTLESFRITSSVRIGIGGVSDVYAYFSLSEMNGGGVCSYESVGNTTVYDNLGQLIEEKRETEYSDGEYVYKSVSPGYSDSSESNPENISVKQASGEGSISSYMPQLDPDSIKNFDRPPQDGSSDKIIFTMNTSEMLDQLKDRFGEYSLDGEIKLNSYTVTVTIGDGGYILSETSAAEFMYTTNGAAYSGTLNAVINFSDLNAVKEIKNPFESVTDKK